MHQRRHNGRAVANDAAGIEFHQLLRKSLHAHRIAFGIAVLDAKVLADRPALSFKTLFEGLDASLGLRIVCEPHQHPDGAHAKLLCIRRDRLGSQCAAEQRDELASLHSITSLANASSRSGTLRPSTFAVFRLITSSNLVGCWTGRSDALAPLRILST